jgi:hypothetical protein
VEEQLAAGLSEEQIAQFIKHHEVLAPELSGHASLPTGTGLGLEPVDQVDDVE